MGANLLLLCDRLAEQTPSHNKFHVTARNVDLFEPITNTAQVRGRKLQASIFKYCLLNAGHHPKSRVPTDLPELAQEDHVQRELLIIARAKKVEQLIDHQQQPMARVVLSKYSHHGLESCLLPCSRVERGKRVVDTQLGQPAPKLLDDNRMQRKFSCADLHAHNLETPSDPSKRRANPIMIKPMKTIGILGNRRNNRHQM